MDLNVKCYINVKYKAIELLGKNREIWRATASQRVLGIYTKSTIHLKKKSQFIKGKISAKIYFIKIKG